MFETFVNRDAFANVDGEHAVDEVEGRVGDRVPVWRGIIKAAHLYLLRHCVGVVVGVELVREGREAAKTDVEDNTK